MGVALLAGCLAISFARLGASTGDKPEGYLAEPKSGHGAGVLVCIPGGG